MPISRPSRLQLPHHLPPLRLAARLGPRHVFAPDDASGAGASRDAGPRVLIVEDDFLVSITVEAELVDAGFTVVGIATSAEQAIELAIAEAPHLVVMDIGLDGPRDGVDAAIEIFRQKGIRSLFASAYHDGDTRQRAEAAEPLGWLAKPYTMHALVVAVRAAMRKVGGPDPQPG
jgi:two-component system, response regulator PdtaR